MPPAAQLQTLAQAREFIAALAAPSRSRRSCSAAAPATPPAQLGGSRNFDRGAPGPVRLTRDERIRGRVEITAPGGAIAHACARDGVEDGASAVLEGRKPRYVSRRVPCPILLAHDERVVI